MVWKNTQRGVGDMRKKIFFILVLGVMVSGCGKPAPEKAEKAEVTQAGAQEVFDQGMMFLQQGNAAAAIHSFDEAIKRNPLDPRAYLILGQTYMRMQEYNRAIDTYTAALRAAPDQGEIYYLLAVNHGLAGNTEEAKVNAERSALLFQKSKDAENFKKALVLIQGLAQSEE
ncbi:MAG: tetratricopeptide repeat protein [Candidatus Omnitrophica bacterium]|nr:tetratricopeptide repeat protein [Candidatus Omnitrophota bacterium]